MIVEMYAGIRGPGIAMKRLGLEPAIGFEWDARACATSAAAGHLSVRADIGSYPVESFAYRSVSGVWASPPCQTFSRAGKGAGRAQLDRLLEQIEDEDWSTMGLDEKTAHILHVGRWITALNPEWVCMEQVTGVQPLWDAYATVLHRRGYSCWTGPLDAVDFGLAQHRKRSMFAASRRHEIAFPTSTHSERLDSGLPAWETIAQRLGWPPVEGRLGFPRRDDTGKSPDGYRTRDWFDVNEVSPTLTEKARSWKVELVPGSWADGRGGNRRRYAEDEAAPTLHFGHDAAAWRWLARDGLRPLLACEALQLQGFPGNYPLAGPKTAQFLQIGNACPPELAAVPLRMVLGQ